MQLLGLLFGRRCVHCDGLVWIVAGIQAGSIETIVMYVVAIEISGPSYI